MPTITSKASRDLGNVVQQLRIGKTRSANPRDLTSAEVDDILARAADLKAQIKEAAHERAVARVNAHTTVEADRVIEQIVESQDATAASIVDHTDAAFANYFGAPAPEGLTAKAELEAAGKLHALSLARVKKAKGRVANRQGKSRG